MTAEMITLYVPRDAAALSMGADKVAAMLRI
jgi:formate dehydrogenase iron-sulfur subunit